MAQKRRDWSALGENQRKRYLARGRKQGWNIQQVINYYESGANLTDWRGHGNKPTGIGEKRWAALKAAAKKAELWRDGDVNTILQSLMQKGFSDAWILRALEEKRDSRTTYRSAIKKAARKKYPTRDVGFDPGRKRYHNRNLVADIEIFYYH